MPRRLIPQYMNRSNCVLANFEEVTSAPLILLLFFIVKKRFRDNCVIYITYYSRKLFMYLLINMKYSLETHSLLTIALANVTKMLHKHTIEILQNHPIQPNMCPIDESLNVMATLWSANCSSIEMKTANNQHHAFVNGCVVYLK